MHKTLHIFPTFPCLDVHNPRSQYSSNPTRAMSNQDADLFDSLLNLEETFYSKGYAAGVVDGERAGLVEGRIFGLEKGFEKYVRMGRLHGKATVWAGRLPSRPQNEAQLRSLNNDRIHFYKIPGKTEEVQQVDGENSPALKATLEEEEKVQPSSAATTTPASAQNSLLPRLSANPRLERHIRTLYALVELSSLSTANTEEAVADFDDRLKRAEGKVKIIEKLIGEFGDGDAITRDGREQGGGGAGKASQKKSSGDGSIEDISSLRVRRWCRRLSFGEQSTTTIDQPRVMGWAWSWCGSRMTKPKLFFGDIVPQRNTPRLLHDLKILCVFKSTNRERNSSDEGRQTSHTNFCRKPE